MADSTPTELSPESMPDVPQLSRSEQAGAVLIVLGAMAITLFIIIALWPSDTSHKKDTLYSCRPFHVQPTTSLNQARTSIDDTTYDNQPEFKLLNKKVADLKAKIDGMGKPTDTDSLNALAAEKKSLTETQDKLKNLKTQDEVKHQNADMKAGSLKDDWCTIQLGNLLLVLVAACGFLGNMIHVSKSLTFHIGMKKFQRSWLPWYFIKPFTASGLALLIYFATSKEGGGTTNDPINLFPIMLTAGLAGLFTDIAIKKLRVVFEAILTPADAHPTAAGSVAKPAVKRSSVDMSKVVPDKIDPRGDNKIKIPGENLDPKTVVVKINGKEIVKPLVTATEINFSYRPADGDEAKSEFLLTVTDASANLKEEKNWKI